MSDGTCPKDSLPRVHVPSPAIRMLAFYPNARQASQVEQRVHQVDRILFGQWSTVEVAAMEFKATAPEKYARTSASVDARQAAEERYWRGFKVCYAMTERDIEPP